nr:myelin protein zero-like protein 1 [Pogona vitticeps]
MVAEPAAAAAAAAAAGGSPMKREISSTRAPARWLLTAGAFVHLIQMALCSSVSDVLIVKVSTPTEIIVEAGTDVKIPCTFVSSEDISAATSVTWSFQQEGSTARPITFFYYSDGKEYLGKNTPFKDRSSFVGNFSQRDASIKIANVQPVDNGTYFCDVKNPPDIVVDPGQVKLTVLEREMPVGHGRAAATPESATVITATKSPNSGNIALNGLMVWPLVLHFCCILAFSPGCLF